MSDQRDEGTGGRKKKTSLVVASTSTQPLVISNSSQGEDVQTDEVKWQEMTLNLSRSFILTRIFSDGSADFISHPTWLDFYTVVAKLGVPSTSLCYPKWVQNSRPNKPGSRSRIGPQRQLPDHQPQLRVSPVYQKVTVDTIEIVRNTLFAMKLSLFSTSPGRISLGSPMGLLSLPPPVQSPIGEIRCTRAVQLYSSLILATAI